MFSPSIYSCLTVLRTLMQVVLVGQRSGGCLAEGQLVAHPATRPGGLPTHRHLHARNESAGRPSLLQSSLPHYHPALAHQKHAGNGSDYRLVFQSIGNTFFDQWDFFCDADPTHGMVEYVDADTAWQEGLVIVQPSSVDKNFTSAIMKVDNYTYLGEGQKRRSVRLSSKQAFKYGLVVLDVLKLPFGCSVWPAFWTVGENWPHGGEIDIVEGVNMGAVNQMTLPGCQVAEKMGRNATGKVLHQDCDATGTGNVGCGVADSGTGSFGAAMNERGGGVFVMEWTRAGISVWRFGRHQIPADLAAGSDPRPASWHAPPTAHWSHQHCSALSQRFSPHKIIFDITLCGDWAGASDVFTANGLCHGTCSSVVKDPAVFNDAYWEVASVKLYQ